MKNTVELEPGAVVKAAYKSGLYVGEVVEVNGARAVVSIQAVIKHPEQGDLHHPYDPDVMMFHERKALSYTEKALVPLVDLELYNGHVPTYTESLQHALAAEEEKLDKLKRWAERSLAVLGDVKKEYKL